MSNGIVITQTHRNAFQNFRCPLYSKADGICQSCDEHVSQSQRPYYGIAHLEDGTFAGVARDFRQPVRHDIRYWVAGIPVLWDSHVLSPREMAPEVGDFCHLYALEVSAHRGANPAHVEIYDCLRHVFEATVHAPADEAAAALETISAGLPREHTYLHHGVAVGPESLIIVVSHGPLEYLGALAHANGASDCVVVDNGGSVQIGLRRPGDRLRPIVESYYFREPTIALAAYEICSTSNFLPFDGMFGFAVPRQNDD